MLCEHCGQRPATVHFTEIANGNKQETRLCEACAGDYKPAGFGISPQHGLHYFLAGLLSNEMGKGNHAGQVEGGIKCQKCGVSEGRFVKQGLLGCGDCYDSFQEQMGTLLRRIHGNNRHTGKVPGRTGGRARLLNEIESLRNKLKEAVAREEYEQAALLRDNIRQLEKNLEEWGAGNVSQGNC